jgi:hypothetical protein
LAILVGIFFHKYLSDKKANYYLLKISFLFICLFSVIMLIFLFPANPVIFTMFAKTFGEGNENKINFGIIPYLSFIVILAGFLLSLFFAIIKKLKLSFYILFLQSISFMFIISIYFLPILDKEFQIPLKNLAVTTKNKLGPNENLIYFGVGNVNIFYFQKKVIILDDEVYHGGYLLNKLASPDKYYVITTYSLYKKIQLFIPVNLIKKSGNYVLLRNF